MISIETQRLHIRNFTPADWQGFQDVIVRYQASDSAKYEPPWPTSDDELQGMVQWFASADDFLCVCLKPAGTVIGLLAIERREDNEDNVRNLGYIFHPSHQGNGYAQEGCRAVMAHVFNRLGAVMIHTGTNPQNEASVRLLNRLGFNRVDEGEFTLTREEWQALNPDLT